MQSYNVNLISSSLHYLQSNCLAEKYVQIVKNLFCKAEEEHKDFYKCLVIYQIPPLQVVCSHLCKFAKVGMLDLTCQCKMMLGNSLVSSLEYLGTLISIQYYLHMIPM